MQGDGVAADAILIVHFAIVLFIAAAVPLIYIGATLKWSWVRDRRWRVVHVGAIVFVAAESVAGITCPLTVWEDRLREEALRSGFIERWVHRIMFYQLHPWVFTVAYIAFAIVVVLTWFAVPPVKRT